MTTALAAPSSTTSQAEALAAAMELLPAAARQQLMTPYPLTPAQAAGFRRDGFIKLKQVLSPDTIAAIRPAIVAAVEQQARSVAPLAERSTYGKAFVQVMNLWRSDALIRALVFAPRLAALASELMDCRGVRIYHDQALFKEAGGGFTPWHADQRYWPLSNDRTVTAWIPLVPVSMDMGPLEFAAGTQRLIAQRRHDQLGLPISEQSDEYIRAVVADYAVNATPYDLGEVSYHYGWNLHRAGPNRTTTLREVMTVIYMDSRMRVIEPQHDHHRNDLRDWMPGCQPGELAASPLNPVLWGN